MKLDKSTVITLVGLLLIIGAAAYFAFNGSVTNEGGEATSAFEELSAGRDVSPYTDINGVPVDLSEYEGKTLVINAWASWCPFCVEELPDLDQLAAEYADRDVVVIGINRKEAQNTNKAFIEHVGSPEHILFLLDEHDTFYKSIGGFSMPETVFYDAAGNVVVHKRGFMGLSEMREHTEKALAAGLSE